jgi:methionyl-tRNA formyltransferase
VEGSRFFVACAGSRLELLEVQLEGKKRMPAADFLRGFQLQLDERVGE